MKAVLILNGASLIPEGLMAHACDHPVYTTTAGCDICLSTGIRPELVVGDVQHLPDDSIPANWKTVQLLDPESTDFECLLRILPPHIRDLTVLGGIEERLDLLLSHLLIASALPENFQISFEHHGQALWRVTPDTPWHGTPELGSTLSLLPMSQVQCVVTRGLDWDLDHEDMNGENKLGRSHHVTGPVSVSIEHGSLFTLAKDRWIRTSFESAHPPEIHLPFSTNPLNPGPNMHYLLLSLLLFLTACSPSTPPDVSSEAEPVDAAWTAVFAPAELPQPSLSIPEARTRIAGGEEVVLEGRIMGVLTPFVPNRAVFVLGDPATITPCNAIDDDHCDTPWDACCDPAEIRKNGTATIQIVDTDGNILKQGLQGKQGLEPLATVRVSGFRTSGGSPDSFVVNATRIQVL